MKTWLALSLLAAGAHAGQRCHPADQPLTSTNWSTTFQFPKHDPTIGQLESVTITLRSRNEFDLGIENLSPVPGTVQHVLGSTVTARRPDSSTILATAVDMSAQATLGPFDGMIDFNGPSGVTFTNLHEFGETSVVLNSPTDLALFTATAPGEAIDLPMSSLGNSSGSGPGNTVAAFATRSSAHVRVCYGYRETCQSYSTPQYPTNWLIYYEFDLHHPSVGPLGAVRLRARTEWTGSAGVENLSPLPVTVTTNVAVMTVIIRPDINAYNFVTTHTLVDQLAPYDGTTDFGGPSGKSYSDITSQGSFDVMLTSPADLAYFTVVPGGNDRVNLNFLQADDSSATSTGGPLATTFTTVAGLQVFELCYDFSSHVVPFCFGDGTGAACPCGNSSPAGAQQGCTNSLGLGGELRSGGAAELGDDTLVFTAANLPATATALFFQGTNARSIPFGDGLSCTSASMSRLGTRTASAGVATFPPSGAPISELGNALPGSTLHYQAWYRNSVPFCTPSGFNTTNGLRITW